jgi:hypothetical protein
MSNPRSTVNPVITSYRLNHRCFVYFLRILNYKKNCILLIHLKTKDYPFMDFVVFHATCFGCLWLFYGYTFLGFFCCISTIFGLGITRDTWFVEMCTWCIKTSIVLVYIQRISQIVIYM